MGRFIPLEVREAINRGDTHALAKMGHKGGKAPKKRKPRKRVSMISEGVKPSTDPEIARLLAEERNRTGDHEDDT